MNLGWLGELRAAYVLKARPQSCSGDKPKTRVSMPALKAMLSRWSKHSPILSSLFLATLSLCFLRAEQPAYRSEIEQWRRQRGAELKAEEGWLTVVGLFWLKEGNNTVGTEPENDIVLPPASAPGKVGVFEFHDGVTTFQAAEEVEVTLNNRPVTRAEMKPDTSGSPDLLRVRDLAVFVLRRGGRYAIRLKDKNSPARKAFRGLEYYPVNERYRVRARFVRYAPPKKIAVPNILGRIDEEASPGYVVFTLNGRECRLDPLDAGDRLFFIFKDPTLRKETYPAGRFLYTPLPKNGEVILDFNKAINPPCAFTAFATCPLPPKQNSLPIRIEAGEKRYGH